ncbi:MAG: HPP family protein [Candidatus Nitricoxidivorans perseverans]|uniref:HPP family protein n=1 Tax=Candidatus Nitricoxidivorans perseverans TaxID=2975601 RepID=A0AA49FJY6_9PROT|nr:MAG: HPP family protein [Candidatus Nitricoxidivorans perseverans]
MKGWREFLKRFLPEPAGVPLAEQWRSALTAAAAVLAVTFMSTALLHTPLFVAAALGASAVMVFALPASPLAQPWSVVMGYAVSALIGVTAARLVPQLPLAAALAVGLCTLGMLALRCMHPPGGAVALFAVVGGDAVRTLGFQYVLSPVLTNALLLVMVALVANNLIPGRHYPRRLQAPNLKPLMRLGLCHEDLERALEHYGRVIDVSGEELDEILVIAEHEARERQAARR